jgi:endonuclease YncB( thermonuclease family)
MRAIAAVLVCFALAAPAFADVEVIDGDTIKVDGETFDLYGIAAPDYWRICSDGWPAGVMAAEVLRAMVRDRKVTCEPRAKSRYSPTMAVCWADGLDLGSMMVRAGAAWAHVRSGSEYVRQEAEARAARAGVHAHNCAPAWQRRTQAWIDGRGRTL